jgi:hypothetical protein
VIFYHHKFVSVYHFLKEYALKYKGVYIIETMQEKEQIQIIPCLGVQKEARPLPYRLAPSLKAGD